MKKEQKTPLIEKFFGKVNEINMNKTEIMQFICSKEKKKIL